MKKTLHFIRFTLFLVLLFASFFRGFGQTTLSVGDVSIIGFNSNTPDNFAFVTWVNLAPNTVIKFTDNGFLSSNSATSTNNGRGGENFVTWTNSSGATILAGTVIKIENGTGNVGTASIGTVNQTLSGISNGGDQIFAYQGVGTGTSTSNSDFGSNANPTTFTGTILFGLTFPNTWLSSGSATSNTSYLPLELNVPNGNIVITPSATGGQYTGSRTNQTTMSAYRSLVNNSSNWTVSTSTGLTNLNTTAFTLAIPTISTTGTLTAVNTTYGTASATPTSFSVSGINLSDNILITPPAGYEVSQTAGGVSGYADTQTLTQTGGTVGSTTIYVRLKATAMVSGSPYFGNIVLSSSGTTSVNVATVSSSVSPKSLTITGITADNKVYDGSNSATISGTPVYVGLENGETFAVNGSPTATFVNAAVGNSKTVTVTGYTTPSSNYTVSQPSLSANITPAPITISNPIAQNKVYDRTTNAVISGTLNGIIGSEVVILNGAGAFVSSAVGDGISVTSTSTLGGADAGNYILTQPTGLTANITVKLLTITGISANNKVYDGNTNATLSGTPSLNGVVAGDENDVILGGLPIANFTQSTVGTSIAVTVTGYSITGSAATNYALSQPSGLVADITNLPTPVITSSLTASATYGVPTSTYTITATNSPTSFNATGLPAGLSINTTTGEISGTPTSTAGSPFSVTISATNDGGTGSAILIYTINKKTITVNPVLAQNKIYDRTNAATISGTLEGIVGTDEVTLVGTGTFAQSSVGDGISVTSTATLAGADAGKYTLAQPTGLVANITKKALTASATGVNKVYDGTTTAQFLATTNLFGVILPDVVSVSGGGNFVSSEVGDDILINPSLVLGGTDADNYSIIQPTGITANITKASLSISGLTATNKTYDGNTSATLNGTPILEGVINNDDVSIAGTVSAIFNNKNIGTAKPVNVTGYTLNGTKAGNYTLTQPTGLTANISALALSLFGATAQNKVFDGNTNATITGTLTGIISPDVVTFAGVGTFATSAVGNGIAVTANITLGGAGASNYTITQPTGLTANITPTPSLTEVIFPQYIQGVNGTNSNRIPFAYRATLNNLIPNATYRYYNGVELTTASLTSAGAGNNIFVDANQSNNFTYSTAPSLSTAGGYGTFTTNANGSYTGWFIIAPSGNATRFVPGNNLYTRIILNNGTGGTSISTVLSSTNTIKVINLVSTAGANNGTGLRGNSGATDKNFVFAYDNTAGTGRPLSGTFVENDGAAQVTSFASFYTSNVDGISGAYGLVIPNDNANGVRRVEQRDFTTGAIAGCAATDEDGTWASGANTVNPTGGTSAIVLTSGDAPLNTCQVFNIAPTIAIDVATTTNYIDGGVDTNISGSYPISAVIDDPTDPAKTLGVDFTIGDTETAVGSLTVTVTSNNTTVVPNANLILTGAGASRNLKITPIASGYAPITITVNDGTTSTIFTLNYAASQAADITTNTRFHTGKSDASTAIKVDNDLMLVADDEDQTIRLYNRNNSGLPVNSFDFTSVLGLTDISGGVPREVDIEASLKIGNSIYWMGSESNASNGNNRPNRNRVFKTDISGTGIGTSLIYVSRYDFLKDDILAWDANNLHGKGANYYGLVASASAGVIPESTALNGFNIEGIEIAPDNTTAYVAFRAPQVIPSDRKKALIIPITNFTSILAANGGTIGSATFGTPIELNLGERGIREIRKNDTNEYLIIAGPADAATGTAPKDFKFYTWTGKPTDEPIKRSFNLSSLNVDGSFESIVEVPSNLNSITNIQLLVDNGDAIYYGDGTIAKELPQNNWKKFRSEIISLSAPVIEVGSIAQNLCEQSSLSLPFVINNETFNSGNIFTAQLSDANGSFANPVSIGTLSSLNSGTINATIPANTVTGTGYRIRIVSSIPTIVGADNGTNLTINAKPSKPTINASSTTICSGNSVTLTASACNGGTLNWTGGLTGSSITVSPTTSSSYTVSCTILGCTSDVSDATTITVNQKPAAPVVSANPNTVTIGQTSTLTASGCTGGIVTWAFNNSTTNPITFTPTSSASYTATCTVNDCISVPSNPVTVTVVTGEPCTNLLTLSSTTNDYNSGTQLKQASATNGKIMATNKVTGTAKVTYQAKSIELNAGFRAEGGTVFKAEIGGCSN